MQDEEHHYEVAGHPVVTRRAAGEALQPLREPVEVLQLLQRQMGHLVFSAQYQQDPLPTDGNLVKRSWFGTYGPADLLQMERILQSWDCASKTLDTHDYSVCLTLGLKQGRIYLIDVFRAKLEMPELVRAVVELANKYGPERVLIEDKGAGIGLLQALRARYFHKGTPIIPKRDKMARFSAITPMIESGAVLLPEQAPWLDDYLHEICGFPATKHDDQIDATSQALEWIQEFASLSGIEEFTRLGSEESRASLEGRNVHLRALDIGNRPILGNGVETPLGVDGTIWVNEQDAATLRAAGYVDVAS